VQENNLHIGEIKGGSKTGRTACLCAGGIIPMNCQRDTPSLWPSISSMILSPSKRSLGTSREEESFLSAGVSDTLRSLSGPLAGQSLQWQKQTLLPPDSNLDHQISIKEVHPHAHKSLGSW